MIISRIQSLLRSIPMAFEKDPHVRRLTGNPFITPTMLAGPDGRNINGPSLIRVPAWLPGKLGKYYLYFAHHHGESIRLAYSDQLTGPWKVYAQGVLHMDHVDVSRVHQSIEKIRHIASPDVHVDEISRTLVMYFHCPTFIGGDPAQKESYSQETFAAQSSDGLHFTSQSTRLGRSYMKMFPWNGMYYAVAPDGIFYRSQDPLQAFEKGPNPFQGLFGERMIRHPAVHLDGDTLSVYHSLIGDRPEQILRNKIHLTPDWNTWKVQPTEVILRPLRIWEGGNLPTAQSRKGARYRRVREVRDPAIYTEDGKQYLLYSVAGESGIAIAEILS
jgi:hypothetical protein